MKNTSLISGVILLILSLFLIHSCKKDKPAPPYISTIDVTEIASTSAITGGDVTDEGGAPVVARGSCWNTSPDPTIDNFKNTINYGGLGSFTRIITPLTPSTKYYVRAYATNSIGTGYGNEVSFTTNPVVIPVLTTVTISYITQKTAVSGGNITNDNGGFVSARGVCWGITPTPTIDSSKTTDNTGTGTFTSSIAGLTPGTTYYVRAYATNSAGTAYGNEISFSTYPPTLPVITTTAVSSLPITTATSGGNVTSDGGEITMIRGICWSTSPNPTKANNIITDDGTGIGIFTSSLTGLVPNTTYYLRAYATNSVGTSYGNELIFKTYAVADIDGNGYYSVTIGTQTWMKENLKTTKYNDVTGIPLVEDGTAWVALSTPGYCWYNNDAATYKNTNGALYNWYTVNTGKLCPTGWHVPTDAEWTILTDYLINNGYGYQGSGTDIAKSMAATTGWMTNTIVGTVGNDQASNNSSGFTGLPAGTRSSDGSFGGGTCSWWSSVEYNASNALYRYILYGSTDVGRAIPNKKNGLYVRCLKD